MFQTLQAGPSIETRQNHNEMLEKANETLQVSCIARGCTQWVHFCARLVTSRSRVAFGTTVGIISRSHVTCGTTVRMHYMSSCSNCVPGVGASPGDQTLLLNGSGGGGRSLSGRGFSARRMACCVTARSAFEQGRDWHGQNKESQRRTFKVKVFIWVLRKITVASRIPHGKDHSILVSSVLGFPIYGNPHLRLLPAPLAVSEFACPGSQVISNIPERLSQRTLQSGSGRCLRRF